MDELGLRNPVFYLLYFKQLISFFLDPHPLLEMLKKNVFIDTIDQMMVKSLLKEEQIPRYFFTTGSVVSGGKNDSGSSVNVLIDSSPA